MGNFTFSGKERLRGEANIKAVFKQGFKVRCNGVSLFVLPNGLQYNRFLCTFRRGFGSAVLRNRSRRISKEAYRLLKNNLKKGHDFILLVFSEDVSFDTRYSQLVYLFEKTEISQKDSL